MLSFAVWRSTKVWMASLIILQQLGSNALERSPTVFVFHTFISARVKDRLWQINGLPLYKATRRVSRKTKGGRTESCLGEVSSKTETFRTSLLEGKSVKKLKQLHSFSTSAYFGRMQVVTNGQCIETPSFGMIVLMQSTRLTVLQGQVRQSSFKFFM